jgi:tRNA threonylcarbamoyladenosine biosynthesis protein TsaB
MLILTIRTDNPDAEVGLYDGETQMSYETWPAHRELSVTLHQRIEKVLATHDKKLEDLQGIVCFQGPGSFTGLRIGLTVADTLSYSLNLPIVATMEEDWIKTGIHRLESGENDQIALPHYGAPAHITQPRK